jgi:hypothetical protein
VCEVIWSAILVACMVSAPADCRTHEMLVTSPMPTAAYIEAQARAAEWLAQHPDLRQIRLTIRPGRTA